MIIRPTSGGYVASDTRIVTLGGERGRQPITLRPQLYENLIQPRLPPGAIRSSSGFVFQVGYGGEQLATVAD